MMTHSYPRNPLLGAYTKYIIYDPTYEQDLVTDYDYNYVEDYKPKAKPVHETKHIHQNGQKCFKEKIVAQNVHEDNQVFLDFVPPPAKNDVVRIYQGKLYFF